LFFILYASVAQAAPLDSLLQLLPHTKEDTAAVLLYIDIGENYRKSGKLQPAAEYHLKAQALSGKLNYLHGLYYASDYYSFILYQQGKYDEAIAQNKKMLALAHKHSDNYQAAIEQWNIGACYLLKGFNETAMSCYLEALEYFEDNDYREETGQLYNQIKSIYALIGKYDYAIRYGQKSLEMQTDTLSDAFGYSLQSLATSYHSLRPPEDEKALACLQKALRIASLNNNAVLEANVHNAMGNILFRQNRTDESAVEYLKAIAVFKADAYPREFCVANIGLGKVAMFRKKFAEAEAAANRNLQIAQSHGIRSEEKNAISFLWELAAARGDFAARNRWKVALDSVQAILVNESMLRAVEELNVKYETERKELQIQALEKERALLRGLSIAVVAVLLLALAALFLLWRWIEQKRLFMEREIMRLEQEKLLIATQSQLDGELKERIRIARDLHDGLGGMLTGLKLNLESVRQVASFDNLGVDRFNNAIKILDDSMLELRRVSNHLMPDALSKHGLRKAVAEFCNVPSGKIVFDWYGSDERLKPQLEEVVYRISYELVNNALKHARASQIQVQIMQELHRIALIVQDNGVGFDTSIAGKGMGLGNIRTRVASLGGHFHISSEIGGGTEAIAEFVIE
jgi:signal transduction histidine kinase